MSITPKELRPNLYVLCHSCEIRAGSSHNDFTITTSSTCYLFFISIKLLLIILFFKERYSNNKATLFCLKIAIRAME